MKGSAALVRLVVLGVVLAVPGWGRTTAPAAGDSTPAETGSSANAEVPRVRAGLSLRTPYARGKFPVVFVHGLWANSSCWDRMIADLRGDQALDERFQFWTFDYATGDPIPYTTLLLRRSWTETRRKLDPDRSDPALDRMILVGHSMGGLLARMMVVASGDRLWQMISPRPPGELRGDQADVAALTQLALLTPQPEVSRVVFIATPHRGSDADSGSLHRLANRLARRTELAVSLHHRLVSGNDPDFFSPYFHRKLPTSVEELQVNGPFLATLNQLPIAPTVRAHSIIAVRPHHQTDGLVTVASARLAGVASEKVVTSPHALCPENPDTIAEVRRILQEHQASADQPPEPKAKGYPAEVISQVMTAP